MSNLLSFEDFKKNVEEWARVRGIYDQSSEAHQKAKALEEIGEYLTAESDDERMDAIGDIAVCIVNAANFCNADKLSLNCVDKEGDDCRYSSLPNITALILGSSYVSALNYLRGFSLGFGGFNSCLTRAWNEIKDRKGMMVNGKYVKWESMSEEQREEFNSRDSGNVLIRQ